MTEKMAIGSVRMGHVVSSDESETTVSVAFSHDGVEVIWPRRLSMQDAYERNLTGSGPLDFLIFKDHSGFLTLRGGRTSGTSMSSIGASQQVIKFRTAIEAGSSGIDYRDLHGMSSEIEGLGRWAGMSTVTTKVHVEGGVGLKGVSIHASNLDSRSLGGPLGLSLETAYWHRPEDVGGAFTITDHLRVRTLSAEPRPWSEHVVAHGMLQDLMCLVYGRPCSSTLVSVMNEKDQPYPVTGNSRWWPTAFDPAFGRGDSFSSLDGRSEPLFLLEHASAERVSSWLMDFEKWSRPTWIAVTTLFQRNSTIEARLLQLGVALEALGFAIGLTSIRSSGKTPSFPQLLSNVTEAVPEIVHWQGSAASTAEWRANFNAQFKGIKHADQPLPDARQSVQLIDEGLNLIRCWLAIELGVSADILRERALRYF